MPYLFGVALPYLALLIFLGGFIYRVVHWAKSPVPFPIQTTCGQGKSLDFIKHNRLEAPNTTAEVVARMFLEIVTFRSLFRNTKSEIHTGPHITYESSKWLWLFALLFHYSFLAIVVRHMRLFLDPVPVWITWIEFVDGIFQVGAPGWYISDVTLVLGCVLLFGRRLVNRHTRVISLMNDYFPLVLIFAIAVSGI
ncbi:MAG: respiratory nitrate reductase subunit gamma, partial [Desulforhopalus sp.]|nr:respiratory nitrate reductase subunit gamma [Desulforhopalus sp.]